MIITKRISFVVALILSNILMSAQDTSSYIFIGHCYEYWTEGDRVDSRVEQLDFSDYAGIWLGGDVCSEAMLKYSTVQYIDSIFDLGNPETHWVLGNHDVRNGNLEWYREFAGKDSYYVYSSKGITRINMNTNILPIDCENLNRQNKIIEDVCDSIEESDFLVLLMHHGLWRDVPGLPHPGVYAMSDLKYWNSNCDDVNSNFINHIYPQLVEVRQRGVEVYCIMGDMGVSKKKIDEISDDGIRFLGCGLYQHDPEDLVLILNKTAIELEYGFHNLDSLLGVQKSLLNK